MLDETQRAEAIKTNKIAAAEAPRLLAVDNEMVVPVGKVVRVQTTGADVIHAFAPRDVKSVVEEYVQAAWDAGHFKKSIVPVKDINGLVMLAHDEYMRPETTLESLAQLKPAFQEQGEKYGFDSVMLQRYPEVERIERYHHEPVPSEAPAPLFSPRSLFRD